VHFQEQGHQVTLLMDDAGGLAMAASQDLTCATIEDVLVLAIHAGCFPALENLAEAYRKLQTYGSGLSDFRHTVLKESFRRWEGQG
jgi:flagellar biosynthesis/type III secretory pathway ATPase